MALVHDFPIDPVNPVNLAHPLAPGAWWRCLPGRSGGAKWPDLLSPADVRLGRHGTLTTGSGGLQTRHWSPLSPPGGRGSLNFPGVDTAYVSVANSAFFTGTAATWAAWLFPTSLAGQACWLMKGFATTSWSFALHWTPSAVDVRVFVTDAPTDAGGNAMDSTNGALVANRWVHITVVYDGSLANASRVKIYKNGQALATSVIGTLPTTLSVSTTALRLGVCEGFGRPFIGNIGEIQIWRQRPLSASQVAGLYTLSQQGYPGLLRRLTRHAAAAAGGAIPGFDHHYRQLRAA